MKTAVIKKLKRKIVYIEATHGEDKRCGTGIILRCPKEKDIVVTCRHVVEFSGTISNDIKVWPSGRPYENPPSPNYRMAKPHPAKLTTGYSDVDDLIILEVAMGQKGILLCNNEATLGATVSLYGYPLGADRITKIEGGTVNPIPISANILTKQKMALYSLKIGSTAGGMSGGPVFSDNERLIGIWRGRWSESWKLTDNTYSEGIVIGAYWIRELCSLAYESMPFSKVPFPKIGKGTRDFSRVWPVGLRLSESIPRPSSIVLGSFSIPESPKYRIPPFLCISDTHLEPSLSAVSEDAPNSLAELLISKLGSRILVLAGDIIESWWLGENRCYDLITSVRTRELFRFLRNLAASGRLYIIPGNHDTFAKRFFAEAFGPCSIFDSGIRFGNINIIHGHEGSMLWGSGQIVMAILLPILHTIARWLPMLGASKIATRVGADLCRVYEDNPIKVGDITIFGHTHIPYVGSRSINIGAFLRHLPKTYLEFEVDRILLLQYLPSQKAEFLDSLKE